MEVSGTILASRLKGYAEALNLGDGDLNAISKYAKYVPDNPSFYAKGTVEVEDGQIVNSDITELKVGNLTLTSMAQDNLQNIIDQAYEEIAAYPGFKMTTLKFTDGQVQFVGALPDSARVIGN
jgi:hypothetical protein